MTNENTEDSIIKAVEDEGNFILIAGSVQVTKFADGWNRLKAALVKNVSSIGRIEVVAESDNELFQISLRSDANYRSTGRASYRDLDNGRQRLRRLAEELGLSNDHVTYSLSSLNLCGCYIQVGERVFFAPPYSELIGLEGFQEIKLNSAQHMRVKNYLGNLLSGECDGKFLYGVDSENLELFDHNKVPRGIFPRSCFYDTDYHQFVVWDFVFSRDGKLLIQKRSETAKDNRSMWDKSVGGHVDFTQERSAHLAAVRELIEELYTDESTDASTSLLDPGVQKPVYLGDWRPDNLGEEFLNSVSLHERSSKHGSEPWVYYRYPQEGFTHHTPRLLPDGGQRMLKVIPEIYIFIANASLNKDVEHLNNSDFRLVDPNDLRTWVMNKKGISGEDFKATPDLTYVMTSHLRELLSDVRDLIQFSSIRKPLDK